MKSFYRIKKFRIMLGTGLAGMLAAFTFIACESGVSSEDRDNALPTAAYNSNQCATGAPIKTFYGKYLWNSSSNYSTSCNAIDDTALGTANYSGYGSSIKNKPTNKANCEGTSITTLFYLRTSNGTGSVWALQKTESYTGKWINLFGAGVCSLPSTSFPPQQRGALVRVATTVRQTSGSSFIALPFSSYLK